MPSAQQLLASYFASHVLLAVRPSRLLTLPSHLPFSSYSSGLSIPSFTGLDGSGSIQSMAGPALFCFVLFCFVLCDRQHSSSGHMAHHRPRMCAAGHTPHLLCGAVRRPRVRLQPIRILEAFAGRDAQSVPSEPLTGPLVLDTPTLGHAEQAHRYP